MLWSIFQRFIAIFFCTREYLYKLQCFNILVLYFLYLKTSHSPFLPTLFSIIMSHYVYVWYLLDSLLYVWFLVLNYRFGLVKYGDGRELDISYNCPNVNNVIVSCFSKIFPIFRPEPCSSIGWHLLVFPMETSRFQIPLPPIIKLSKKFPHLSLRFCMSNQSNWDVFV